MNFRTRQPTTIEELLDKVVVCMSGCWIWTGGDSGEHGRGAHYGRILRPGTRNAMAAHRYVYERFSDKGPIPPGWHVDHVCHGEVGFLAGFLIEHRMGTSALQHDAELRRGAR